MHRVITLLLFSFVLLPVWAWRRLAGSSRFGRRFHARASPWDRQAISRVLPANTQTGKGRRHGNPTSNVQPFSIRCEARGVSHPMAPGVQTHK